jgi:hypothetical protein
MPAEGLIAPLARSRAQKMQAHRLRQRR